MSRSPELMAEIIADAACGDEHAESYLMLVADLVALADDLTDENPPFAERQDIIIEILTRAFVALPLNPFHARHAVALAPLVQTILVAWKQSDDWKQTGDLKRKLFAFVRRENIDFLVVAVAAIKGGNEHAAYVSERLMDLHVSGGETLEDWIAEERP